MSIGKRTLILMVTLSPWFAAGSSVAAPAVGSGAQSQPQSSVPDIGALERRYFGRTYDKDATDKRIQRLELLLFGATQDGGMVERLDRVQQSAAERAKASRVSSVPGSDAASIAALERKILKKSFDGEPPAQRLGRLESKVFGQASPSMSVADRVFRLKKILNVETPSVSRLPSVPELNGMGGLGGNGGMGSIGGLGGNGLGGNGGLGGNNGMGSIGGLGGSGDMVVPFGSFSFAPFANGRPDEMTQQMNEMIKQLNKSLRGIHKLPDGAPDVAPFSGPGSVPFSGPNLSPFSGPNGTPFVQPFRTLPQQQHRDTELPPYLDPNSI